jgi:ubiquinone/menaquinone biosynthesis C-methylase UbiE
VTGAIHDAAAAGFAVGAGAYVTGRPDYPPEAAQWLREVLGLGPGKTVLDLGAGTGKFIRYLKDTGARVVAVEPVDAMRAELSRRHHDVDALAGTAEAIPLPDASLDAVVCAQAFHWFATTRALPEIRRVLRVGGMLGLIWNVRDESVPWVAAVSAITTPMRATRRATRAAPGNASFRPRDSPPPTSGTRATSMSAVPSTSSSTAPPRPASSRRCRLPSRMPSSASCTP